MSAISPCVLGFFHLPSSFFHNRPMAGHILVGTCSWTDKTLIDSGWYPPEAKKPEDRLRFYEDR